MTTFLIVFGVVLAIILCAFVFPDHYKIPIAYVDVSNDIRYLPKKRSIPAHLLDRTFPVYEGQRIKTKGLTRYITQGDIEGLPSGTYLYVAHNDFDFKKRSLVVTSRRWDDTKRYMLGIWIGKVGAETYRDDIQSFPWIPEDVDDAENLVGCAHRLFNINPGMKEGCVIYVLDSGKPDLLFQPLELVKGRVVFRVLPDQK